MSRVSQHIVRARGRPDDCCNAALLRRPRPATLFGMVTDKDNRAGRAQPPATGWGVLIALVLVVAIFLFTGFESHWL